MHAIEAVILESSPALREKPFTIESRKRVAVGGVHHEIDIFVTVEIAKGYTSIFFFECKNCEDAVGKNEIIVVSEKIDAVSAQRKQILALNATACRKLGQPLAPWVGEQGERSGRRCSAPG